MVEVEVNDLTRHKDLNTEGVRPASQVLRLWRRRREEMKLKWGWVGTYLLNGMIREPMTLPLARVTPPLHEFQASKAAEALLLHKIKVQWFEKKVLGIEQGAQGMSKVEFKPFEGTLKQVYCNALLEPVKHYEKIGLLAEFSHAYWELRDALEGKVKSFEEDESFEDVVQPEVQPETQPKENSE